MNPRPLRPALIALAAILVASCARPPAQATELRYGLTLSPTGIDPHINASAELGIPLSSVYDTLVIQDPDTGAFLPGLAESWGISPDGLTYVFHLRRDVRFHDGTTFEADDVVANLDYVVDPDHHSQMAVFLLGPFDRAEATDRYTVAVRLTEPFAPLLDSLSQVYLGMASPEALAEWGPADYPFHQVGTGPYRFVEYVANAHTAAELDFGAMGKAIATIDLKPVAGGTSVTWGFRARLDGVMERWLGLLFDRWIGADYEKGLAKLRRLIETQAEAG